MSQSLTILGPNLFTSAAGRAHGETFHVHATGCADIARYGRSGRGGEWTYQPESFAQLAREIYEDQIEEGSMDVDEAMSDIWLAPCVEGI